MSGKKTVSLDIPTVDDQCPPPVVVDIEEPVKAKEFLAPYMTETQQRTWIGPSEGRLGRYTVVCSLPDGKKIGKDDEICGGEKILITGGWAN